MTLALDALLALALLALALGAVAGAALFRSIVMFIVFGVVLALAWGRIGAPDLALAEAAIGAGLTGALLLVSYRRLVRTTPRRTPRSRPAARLALPLGLLSAALVLGLGASGFGLEDTTTAGAGTVAVPSTAGQAVLAEMASLPLDNPVTAVLLIFRGYDTLLELTVLLAAYLGARLALGGSPPLSARSAPAALPMVGALLAIVVPLSALVSLHLLHAGSDAPGGAFQGGAVLAAAGVLLVLSGRLRAIGSAPTSQRLLLVLGTLTFLGFALAARLVGAALFTLPGMWAIYLIESALLLSIALTLVLLFAAGGGLAWGRE